MRIRRDEQVAGVESDRSDARSVDQSGHRGPYEYPALEPEVGYWAAWWAEFTRLLSLFWNDGYTKPVVYGSTLVMVGTVILCRLFGWS